MWILPLVGYVGLAMGFSFLVLAIASGLYYLSELVEEHTVIAKKLLTRQIYAVIVTQILLLVIDRLPFLLIALAVASHVVYLQNLRRFPIVKLTDPVFVLSCILVIVNHYLWFRHFSVPPKFNRASGGYPYYSPREPYGQPQPTFGEVASFFGLCVWLVPFSLFVSLSASENVLPSMGSEYATGEGSSFISPGKDKGKREGLVKVLVDNVRGWMGGVAEAAGLRRGEGGRGRF